MGRAICLCLFVALLAGCGGIGPPVIVSLPPVSPSPTPAIHSPTPPFVPSPTPGGTTETAVPVETFTATAGATATVLPATPTGMAFLSVDIIGCNTSLDVRHRMVEVTNAFSRLQNTGTADLTGVCATLSASDEARPHPDKTVCIPSLPAGHQMTLKLTVDTGAGEDTSIQVNVTSDQGSAFMSRPSCTAIGLPGWVPDQVGVLQPIP